MKKKRTKKTLRDLRRARVRSRVSGDLVRPRLFVFKSNKYTYAGLADDVSGKVLMSKSDFKSEEKKATKKTRARSVGKQLGKTAIKKGVKKVVFDRGGYKYHGRVKEVAEGARSAGLIF